MCVRAFSEEWALMSLQRAVALLRMREGWPGTQELREAEPAVVFLCHSPPAASRPSSATISRGLEPACSAFSQPTHALDQLAAFEGLIRTWRRCVITKAMLSNIMSPSTTCHVPTFLSVESSLLSEHLLCLYALPYAKSPKNPLCWLPR